MPLSPESLKVMDAAFRREAARRGSYTEGGGTVGDLIGSRFRQSFTTPLRYIAGADVIDPLEESRQHAAEVAANFGMTPEEVRALHGDVDTLGRGLAGGLAGLAGELPYYALGGEALNLAKVPEAIRGGETALALRRGKAAGKTARELVGIRAASRALPTTLASRAIPDALTFGAVRGLEEGHDKGFLPAASSGALEGAAFGGIGHAAFKAAPTSRIWQKVLAGLGYGGLTAAESKATTGQVDIPGSATAAALGLFMHGATIDKAKVAKKIERARTPGTTEYKGRSEEDHERALIREEDTDELTQEVLNADRAVVNEEPTPMAGPPSEPQAPSQAPPTIAQGPPVPVSTAAPVAETPLPSAPGEAPSTMPTAGEVVRKSGIENRKYVEKAGKNTPLAALQKEYGKGNLRVKLTSDRKGLEYIKHKDGRVLWTREVPEEERAVVNEIDEARQREDAMEVARALAERKVGTKKEKNTPSWPSLEDYGELSTEKLFKLKTRIETILDDGVDDARSYTALREISDELHRRGVSLPEDNYVPLREEVQRAKDGGRDRANIPRSGEESKGRKKNRLRNVQQVRKESGTTKQSPVRQAKEKVKAKETEQEATQREAAEERAAIQAADEGKEGRVLEEPKKEKKQPVKQLTHQERVNASIKWLQNEIKTKGVMTHPVTKKRVLSPRGVELSLALKDLRKTGSQTRVAIPNEIQGIPSERHLSPEEYAKYKARRASSEKNRVEKSREKNKAEVKNLKKATGEDEERAEIRDQEEIDRMDRSEEAARAVKKGEFEFAGKKHKVKTAYPHGTKASDLERIAHELQSDLVNKIQERRYLLRRQGKELSTETRAANELPRSGDRAERQESLRKRLAVAEKSLRNQKDWQASYFLERLGKGGLGAKEDRQLLEKLRRTVNDDEIRKAIDSLPESEKRAKGGDLSDREYQDQLLNILAKNEKNHEWIREYIRQRELNDPTSRAMFERIIDAWVRPGASTKRGQTYHSVHEKYAADTAKAIFSEASTRDVSRKEMQALVDKFLRVMAEQHIEQKFPELRVKEEESPRMEETERFEEPDVPFEALPTEPPADKTGMHSDKDVKVAELVAKGKVKGVEKLRDSARQAVGDRKRLDELKKADSARPKPTPELKETAKIQRRQDYQEAMELARKLGDRDTYQHFAMKLNDLSDLERRITFTRSKREVTPDLAEVNRIVDELGIRPKELPDSASDAELHEYTINRGSVMSATDFAYQVVTNMQSKQHILKIINSSKKESAPRIKKYFEQILDRFEEKHGRDKLPSTRDVANPTKAQVKDTETPEHVQKATSEAIKTTDEILSKEPQVSPAAKKKAQELFESGASKLVKPEGTKDEFWKDVVNYVYYLRRKGVSEGGVARFGILPAHAETYRKAARAVRKFFYTYSPTGAGTEEYAQTARDAMKRGRSSGDAEYDSRFEAGMVSNSEMRGSTVDRVRSYIAESFNYGYNVVKNLSELGKTKRDIDDFYLIERQHAAEVSKTMPAADTIVSAWFEKITTPDEYLHVAKLIDAWDQFSRSKRGLLTELGEAKDARQRWANIVAKLESEATDVERATAHGIQDGLKVIGKQIERDGGMPPGTVERIGAYFPHEVLDFISHEIRTTMSPQAQVTIFGHAKHAHGSARLTQKDMASVLVSYITGQRLSAANNRRIAKLIGKFSDHSKGVWNDIPKRDSKGQVMVDEKGNAITERKLVGAAPGYAIWNYDGKWSTHTSEQLARILHANTFDDFAKMMEPFGMTKQEAHSAWVSAQAALHNPDHIAIIPEGLADHLDEITKHQHDAGVAHLIGKANRFWKKQMVGRLGMYTFIMHARNINGDVQFMHRSDPESLTLIPHVAEKLLGERLGGSLFAKFFKGYYNVTSKLAKTLSKHAFESNSVSDAEFTSYFKDFVNDGVYVGKFLGEAQAIFGEGDKLRTKLSELEGTKYSAALEGLRKKFRSADHIIEAQQMVSRLSKYILDRRRGLTRGEAAQANADTFIDYQLLTNREKWLRDTIFPFYTFRMGNTKGWAQAFFGKHQAGRAQAIASFMMATSLPLLWNYWIDPEGEEKVQNDEKNAYLARTAHINTGLKLPGGASLYIADPIPSSDIARLFGVNKMANEMRAAWKGEATVGASAANVVETMLETLAGSTVMVPLEEMTPLVRNLFELGMNRSIFYKVPIRTEDAPAWMQAGEAAHFIARNWDRQLSTIEGMWFNKSPEYIKALKLAGMPIMMRDTRLGRTNREIADEAIFGRIHTGRTPKDFDDFLAQAGRVFNRTQFKPDEIERIKANWNDIKQIIAEGYVSLTSQRLIERSHLVEQFVKQHGLEYKGADLMSLPEKDIEVLRSYPRFKELTRIDEGDRQRIFKAAFEATGVF